MRTALFNRVVRSACLVAICGFGIASADSGSGSLFFTTFNPEPDASQSNNLFNVWTANYSFNTATSSFSLTGIKGIANLGGADGIVFDKNNNLIVGGQSTDNLFEITQTGTLLNTKAAGTGGYALAMNASQTTLFDAWNGPGQGGSTALSRVDVSSGGLSVAGVPLTVSCDASSLNCSTDVRGVTFDTDNNTWYYGTAPDNGTGEFGTVTFGPGDTATLHRLSNGQSDHDVLFDPFTHLIIANSGNNIVEIDPATGQPKGASLSTFTKASQEYDAVDTDGKGHYFASSNTGQLTFIALSGPAVGIGDPNPANVFSAVVNLPFLGGKLDDVALPGGCLSNCTPTGVPEPSSAMLFGTAAALAMFVMRKRIPGLNRN